MPSIVDLTSIAQDKKYKPRPGTWYRIATDPDVIAVLQPPTDARVRDFDGVAQANAVTTRALQKLTRERMAQEKRAANQATDGLLDELAQTEEELERLETEIQKLDATNPGSDSYYVLSWLRKLDAGFEFFTYSGTGDTLGEEIGLDQVMGIQTRVVQRAVSDWQGLAFLSDDSRG